jgi:hypothetical protein
MACKEQCCGTTCNRGKMEEELKLQGATEFAHYLILQGELDIADTATMLSMVDDCYPTPESNTVLQ